MAAVRKMLVKCADVKFPMFIDEVIKTDLGQNIEGKILALALPKLVGAVDEAGADSARSVGLEAPARLDKDMAETSRDPEITILRAAENRLDHGQQVDLVIAAEEALIVAIDPPAHSTGEKLGADFIRVRIPDKTQEISGLGRELELRRLKGLQCVRHGRGGSGFARAQIGAKNGGGADEKWQSNAPEFHERAERYFEFLQLQSSRTIVMLRS